MTIGSFQLLRNIGQFDSVDAGAQLPFTKLTLMYAENGRGKTTLATILRSVAANDPILMAERQRLGSANPPHIVIARPAGPTMFQNAAWTVHVPEIAVFDDAFVAANVCAGIEIAVAHRQNLHELILGAQGVTLNAALQSRIDRVEEHNQTLRRLEAAIPADVRESLTVDAFCAIQPEADIEAAIGNAERNLAAARAADGIRQHATFLTITLPAFNVAAINAILARTLPTLEAEAAGHVRDHIRKLGRGGEAWVSDGMNRIAGASADAGHSVCPFCEQDMDGLPVLQHYQAYFSEAYQALRAAITEMGQAVSAAHSGEINAAFERGVRVLSQGREFWRAFLDVPEVGLDTAAVARDWNAAREGVLATLRAKLAAPLDAMALPPETVAAIEAYDLHRAQVAALSAAFTAINPGIALVKEQAAVANLAAAQADVAQLRRVQTRYSERIAHACQVYLDEKAAKAATEAARRQARAALDNYRQNIFPAYEAAINFYLGRFNAGFRLQSVEPVNSRTGSSCSYNVLINNVAVALTAAEGPSFRTTLSAGDRNTLALAFFFASMDQDPELAQKIVVIDDPMTSLDEHRSLTTVQQMRALLARVSQMIVLSHSKPFLCRLWEGADPVERSAMLICRDGEGSTLAVWDVNQDCITEHDRRHEMVRGYLQAANPAVERQVASALRPILESFMRVAYPATFPPGTMLGQWLGICEQRLGTPRQVLGQHDIAELRALLDYANQFHHDANQAWETAAINDQELLDNCRRVMAFTQRN